MHLRSKDNKRLQGVELCFSLAAFAVAVCLPINALQAPAPNAAATQATSSTPAAASQPALDVDRDPVPSPDADPPPQPMGSTQQAAPLAKVSRGSGGQFTLREDAYEVRLNVSVFDPAGHSVQTLGKDAFHVYEDGVAQTMAGFRHEDLPVSLGILIDSSGSMYDKRQAVDEASLDLIKLSNPEDEAFVVDFSWEAYIDQDFTSNIDKLQQGLSYIKSSGGTAIYDALVESADYLSKNAKHPKQVLLVITDGEDNASSATLDQAIRRIQDFDGPVIYCVGLLFGDDSTKSETRHARRVLETLSEETGGQAYFPKSVKEVDAIAREVANDIRTQYTIAYHSTKSPTLGGYRTVHVEAREKGYPKLSVRTRTGYYPRVGASASTSSSPSNP